MTSVTRESCISRQFDRDCCTIGTISESLTSLCHPPQIAHPTPQLLLSTQFLLTGFLLTQFRFALLLFPLRLLLRVLLLLPRPALRPQPRLPLHPSQRRNCWPRC
jgi:hypothetical protein